MITKDPKEIESLRKGGRILAEVLALVVNQAKAGISAYDLDVVAESEIKRRGAKPSFKNYKSQASDTPFPSSLCVSINDEVVHGIARRDKILKSGDVVGLDLGVEYNQLFVDGATTIAIGEVDPKITKLIQAAKQALSNALAVVKAGVHTGDIGFAIEETAKAHGFAVVRELVGHGVGKAVHEDPEIPCFGQKGEGVGLVEGQVIAIEPMLVTENWKIKFAPDGWTVETVDGGIAAHEEHTILVTKTGCEVLTRV